MVELSPPVDGLDQVRGEAGRRRRRRAGVVGASLTTAAGVAVVVALSGGPGGLAVLKPAPPAAPGGIQPTPTVTGAAGVGRATQHHQAHAGRPPATRHTVGHGQVARSGDGTESLPPPADAMPQSSGQVSRAQQPTLSRWQSTYPAGGVQQCSGSTYGGTDGSFESAVGWCLTVLATPVSDGVQLLVQLCRDSTGGGTLSYSGSREVDLAVRQGNRTLWDWATLHPGGNEAHRMSVPANGCWNWSLDWPDVTTAGGSAGHGNFTFVGISTADEMKGGDSQSVAFSY